MSLAINTTTPEGIVLAADSRQSYRNRKGASRVGSDSALKLFRLSKKIGLAVTGLAFLPDNGELKSISKFIEQFIKLEGTSDLSVPEIANKLKVFFEEKYQYKKELEILPRKIEADLKRQGCVLVDMKEENNYLVFKFKGSDGVEKQAIAGVDQLQFIVCGFNSNGSHQVFNVSIPGGVETMRDSTVKGREYGANWIGQTDVVTRIVLGYDHRLQNLPVLQDAILKQGPAEIQKQIIGLEYNIQWGTMTLQDGIDFSKLAIETTTAIQRFSDGVKGDPGDIPGVGGPIDIAVITNDTGFVWIAKKNLSVGDTEVNLEHLMLD